MPPVRDQAIVLRHLDYSETSQVLACLTRAHGPRRFIAKGIKRGTKNKAASIIDLLELGEVVFLDRPHSDAELSILTEWRQSDAHLGLRRDLLAWYAAQYAAEITSAMTQEADPHPELFDALAGLLDSLSGGAAALPGLLSYQCALLIVAGLWPDLSRCVVCGRTAPPGRAGYYGAVQGGLVCRNCQPTLTGTRYLSASSIDALRNRAFQDVSVADLFTVMDDTIGMAAGRPTLLGSEVLKSALGRKPRLPHESPANESGGEPAG